MTARLLKPSAGVVARTSKAMVDSGDGAVYPVLGGIGSIASALAGIFATTGTDNPAFTLFFIVPFVYAISIFSYATKTVEISYNDYHWYKEALKHWRKIEGSDNESLARPMLEQIYKCTIEKHPSARSGCTLCREREQVMKELIPNAPSNKDDIEAAKRFLENKKEADALHAQALKELLS